MRDKKCTPDVQITFQPFTISNDGTSPLHEAHGCQFVLRLLRPRSRGVIGRNGSIDPRYFTHEDDARVLQDAVLFVKNDIAKRPSIASIVDTLVAERLESSGVNGGSCANYVDLQTHGVHNTSHLYVCDGSTLPFPISGALTPYKLALADIFVDTLKQR
uniref:Choline dehydrogenase n=1 Tax=Lygus hesperus TaxID=30085 RepID=A0A0A9XE67_LYGHE